MILLLALALVGVCLVIANGLGLFFGAVLAWGDRPNSRRNRHRQLTPAWGEDENVFLLRGEPLTEADLRGWDGGDELDI